MFNKVILIILLITTSNLFAQEENSSNSTQELNLKIAKIVDDKNLTFVFYATNSSKKSIEYANFLLNSNNVYFAGSSTLFFPLGSYKRAPLYSLIPEEKQCQYLDVEGILKENFKYRKPANMSIEKIETISCLSWSFTYTSNVIKKVFLLNPKETMDNYSFLYKDNSKYKYNEVKKKELKSIMDQPVGVHYKIAKVYDKPLDYQLIIQNDTDKEVEVPEFYSENNQFKILFPDGKTFTPGLKEESKGKAVKIEAGKAHVIRFSIPELLKASKEFSMDNFNYGFSKMIWEVELHDKTEVSREVDFFKTEKLIMGQRCEVSPESYEKYTKEETEKLIEPDKKEEAKGAAK